MAKQHPHGLLFEGAPHDSDGRRILTVGSRWQGVGGVGRAKCRCGEMSEELPSSYKRKQWHREVHKPAVLGS